MTCGWVFLISNRTVFLLHFYIVLIKMFVEKNFFYWKKGKSTRVFLYGSISGLFAYLFKDLIQCEFDICDQRLHDKTLSYVNWCTPIYHCVKSVRIRSYSGPYFPAFGLNIQPKYGKLRTEITPNMDTFYVV